MAKSINFLVISCICVISIKLCLGQPGKDNMRGMEGANLRHEFRSQDEIPQAFFDPAPTSSNSRSQERRVYPPCQDGSGGICVEQGQCPPDLKATSIANSTVIPCGPGLECCYGPGLNDKSCGSRGGECMSPTTCGGQPKFAEADDCDKAKGEVCCILI